MTRSQSLFRICLVSIALVLVACGDEPLEVRMEKMGKSKLNGVDPMQVIEEYGADAVRLYELFMGPLEQQKPWQTKGAEGVHRFLQRVWRLVVDEAGGGGLNPKLSDEPGSFGPGAGTGLTGERQPGLLAEAEAPEHPVEPRPAHRAAGGRVVVGHGVDAVAVGFHRDAQHAAALDLVGVDRLLLGFGDRRGDGLAFPAVVAVIGVGVGVAATGVTGVLGGGVAVVAIATAAGSGEISAADIEAQIAARAQARADKDFATADRIRDDLLAQGIELEDLRGETRWRRL